MAKNRGRGQGSGGGGGATRPSTPPAPGEELTLARPIRAKPSSTKKGLFDVSVAVLAVKTDGQKREVIEKDAYVTINGGRWPGADLKTDPLDGTAAITLEIDPVQWGSKPKLGVFFRGTRNGVEQDVELATSPTQSVEAITKFKLNDTFCGYDRSGNSITILRPRGYDANSNSTDFHVRLTVSRPCFIHKVNVKKGERQRVFTLSVPAAKPPAYQVLVDTPGDVELDAEVIERELDIENRTLPGAKQGTGPVPGPGTGWLERFKYEFKKGRE